MKNIEQFIKFVNEREQIFLIKQAGAPKPWTKDKILQQYRFCNIRREDDKVTRWIADHWRQNGPEVWFAMVVARYINSIDTLQQLDYPVPWNKRHFYHVLKKREQKGLKIYNPAYIIVPGNTKMPKAEYLAELVFSPLWKARLKLRPTPEDTLQSFYNRLSQYRGMGTFMSAQVIADLKYVKPLSEAADWWTFAKSGPGSKRGLNRVIGRDPHTSWDESSWYNSLLLLRHKTTGKIPHMHMQDLQNCCCEFDKYERARIGEGKPKQKYNGTREIVESTRVPSSTLVAAVKRVVYKGRVT